MYFSDTTDLERAASIAECGAVKNFSANEECVIGHYVDKEGKDVILPVNGSLQNPTKVNIDLGGELEYYSIEYQKWGKPLLTNSKGGESPLGLEPGCGIALRAR